MNSQKLHSLAKSVGTPMYAYDAAVLEQNVRALRCDGIDVFYSLKANPNPAIAKVLLQHNVGAEVCSFAELHIALSSGYAAENIIYVGPYKSQEALQFALDQKIYAIVCGSMNELQVLNQLAVKAGVKANVLIRINPSFSVKSALLKMGGRPSHFGIDVEHVEELAVLIEALPNISVRGIHVYNGTRILNVPDIIENTRRIFQLAVELETLWCCQFDTVDIGGGVGIPYYPDEPVVDHKSLCKSLENITHEVLMHRDATRIIMESGRYLVGTAGELIVRVCDIKQSHGEQFAIVDGGMNCHLASACLGAIVRRHFPMYVLSEHGGDETGVYQVAGPLCTPMDILAKDICLPTLHIGDLIVIEHVGAYGPSASPTQFLSHGYPNEVLFDQAAITLIRKADSVDKIVDQYCQEAVINA